MARTSMSRKDLARAANELLRQAGFFSRADWCQMCFERRRIIPTPMNGKPSRFHR